MLQRFFAKQLFYPAFSGSPRARSTMAKKIWMQEIARGLGYHVTVCRPYAAPRKKKLKRNQPPIPVNQQ